MKHYDAIVIGTGQAGPALAKRLAASGMTVAIIERKHFGGTCVNTGCTPTKALVASAYAAHMARRAGEFGVKISGPVSVDMKQVKARMEAIFTPSTQGVERSLRETERCTVYQGHARFVSPREVAVGNDVLAADKIFINVGGRASVPDMPGLGEVDFLTNSSILKLDFLPRHLIVVGGSYIGLEFAQIYRRFGSDVTVIEMSSRLVPREDADVSAAIRDILEREGIGIRLDAKCISAGKRGADITAGVDCREGAPEVVGSHLLLAVGRRPNSDGIGGVRDNEDGPGSLPKVPTHLKRILNAGNEIEVRQYPKLGDRVFSQAKYADIKERVGKDGSRMLIVTTENIYTNQNGEVLCILRASTIRR